MNMRKLLDDAENESQDVVTRYEKYAAAQAWLTDSSLVIPTMTSSGAATVVSKVVPFSGPSSQTGNKDQLISNMLKFKMNLSLKNNMIKHVKNG